MNDRKRRVRDSNTNRLLAFAGLATVIVSLFIYIFVPRSERERQAAEQRSREMAAATEQHHLKVDAYRLFRKAVLVMGHGGVDNLTNVEIETAYRAVVDAESAL